MRMMLEHLGESTAARDVERAVQETLASGMVKTHDMGGRAKTQDMGNSVKAAFLKER
jgi:tartrate dehydrogenase/decarboxylase/D-malate dehydrogenase